VDKRRKKGKEKKNRTGLRQLLRLSPFLKTTTKVFPDDDSCGMGIAKSLPGTDNLKRIRRKKEEKKKIIHS